MHSVYRFILCCLLLSAGSGPLRAESPATRPTTAPSTRPVGWLLHLPGIGGAMRIDKTLTTGLIDAGVPASDVTIYDWTGVDRGLVSLGNVHRHTEQSKIVHDLILDFVHAHPDEHITFTAHSAGTGIAVWALEQLPEDVKVDDLVLIASALSPHYDLTKALRHVKHHAYAFNSALDVIVLGTGTKMFGTVDRVQGNSAGLTGFSRPESADAEQYAKFTQFSYDPDWMRFGNNGEHIGPMTRAFAREVIGRVLLGKGVPPRATTEPAEPSKQDATSNPSR